MRVRRRVSLAQMLPGSSAPAAGVDLEYGETADEPPAVVGTTNLHGLGGGEIGDLLQAVVNEAFAAGAEAAR